MKILLTGACGFVGRVLAEGLTAARTQLEVIGLDNLSRPGSELNRAALRQRGVRVFHGDIRNPSDLESLPHVEWVLDAAANPSVLAGVSGQTSSRQLIEHNLVGTVNLLEFCKRIRAGFLMLSTSRVYSMARLAALPTEVKQRALLPKFSEFAEPELTERGIGEGFSTEPPLSLYGTSKRASEILALEYGAAFQLPVHINRCGVLAGAGQFGKPDQGIFSFWIHSYAQRRSLKYIGYGGGGFQVRDCLHPRDLVPLLLRQMDSGRSGPLINVSGGLRNSLSLAQLSDWCAHRFGPHNIGSEPQNRPFDIPWLVLDSTAAKAAWAWEPTTSAADILEEIARHAEANPNWLGCSADL